MIRINLLPIKQLQAEVTRRREIIIGSVVLGSVLLLLVGAHLYQSWHLSNLEKELTDLRAELQALNAKVKEVSDLQVKIKDLRGKQKIIEDLNNKKSGPVLVMASLSQATPASLWLTELRESGGSITMVGLATDNETVANFLRSLTASKYFADIELVETIQGSGATATLKRFTAKARAVYRPAPAPDPQKAGAPKKVEEKKG
jgi:type IV pilus assembly protein PilN